MDQINYVLLPGWKNKKESLNGLYNLLAKYDNVHAFNFPIVKCNNDSFTIDDYVEYLNELIKNLDNVVLIGHSFGGKIASFYALKYKVKGLVLIAPSTYIKQSMTTKIKIIFNKIFTLFKIKKPIWLKGSNDYQKLNEYERKTFKNVLKYLSKKQLNSLEINVDIIGFKNDKSVKIKDLKYLNKHIKKSKLHIYTGDHFGYLEHLNEIVLLIGDKYGSF